MFSEEQGRLLTTLARAAIAREFDRSVAASPHPDWLMAPGAVFVTLTEAGRLRGCIGSLEAHRPLGEDVEHNARAAAFHDPRFPPLAPAELPSLRVEVSVLTPATPMAFTDEDDALAQLRPGVDGLILEHGYHRSTFLPQVWEQLPDPRQFMSHLKQKAGLSGDFWAKDLRLSRYGVEKFKEDLA
ncbi:MAG: AmmeMemoRadiSam system protein A [Pseudomonadota bacterium]|nr:AmmeMemoRadiSam system protein A [Pseudomonadota bacterium]